MAAKPAFNEPSKTIAIDGEVVVEGPEGIGHAFTPAAARETGTRLAAAADQADAQTPGLDAGEQEGSSEDGAAP